MNGMVVVALSTGERRSSRNTSCGTACLSASSAVPSERACRIITSWPHTSFSDDTPLALILAARPEVLVKGGDWPLDRIVGADAVRGWGGQVHSIAFEHERSTTSMLEKIRQAR